MKFHKDFLEIGEKCVLADVHLGLLKLFDKDLLDRISFLANNYEEVIIAGDLKHLGKKTEFKLDDNVIFVKGNHDAKLSCERVIFVKKFAVFHGHFIPEDALDFKRWIVGHAHPAVYLYGIKNRVFLVGKNRDREIIVLPAFNEICSSTAVNLSKPAGKIFKEERNWFVLFEGVLMELDVLKNLLTTR